MTDRKTRFQHDPIPEEITYTYTDRDGAHVTRTARLSGTNHEGLNRYVGILPIDFVPDSLHFPVVPGRAIVEIELEGP